MRSVALSLALFSASLPAQAWAQVFHLDQRDSTLSYKVVHKFHEVEAKTSKLEGAVALRPDGALIQIRVDVASFDSGNANRDAHAKESTEPEKYPYATLKGVIKGFKLPASYPSDQKARLTGQLQFHGQTNPIEIPVTLHLDSPRHGRAKSDFDISLDAYKVERPSLMFVKLEDDCHIAVDLDIVAK